MTVEPISCFSAKHRVSDIIGVDPPAPRTGDEADVNSEDVRRNRRSQTPKDSKGTEKSEGSKLNAPVEIKSDEEDEEDEDGDEEVFAVEKVISHRIGKKSSVLSHHNLFAGD